MKGLRLPTSGSWVLHPVPLHEILASFPFMTVSRDPLLLPKYLTRASARSWLGFHTTSAKSTISPASHSLS